MITHISEYSLFISIVQCAIYYSLNDSSSLVYFNYNKHTRHRFENDNKPRNTLKIIFIQNMISVYGRFPSVVYNHSNYIISLYTHHIMHHYPARRPESVQTQSHSYQISYIVRSHSISRSHLIEYRPRYNYAIDSRRSTRCRVAVATKRFVPYHDFLHHRIDVHSGAQPLLADESEFPAACATINENTGTDVFPDYRLCSFVFQHLDRRTVSSWLQLG